MILLAIILTLFFLYHWRKSSNKVRLKREAEATASLFYLDLGMRLDAINACGGRIKFAALDHEHLGFRPLDQEIVVGAKEVIRMTSRMTNSHSVPGDTVQRIGGIYLENRFLPKDFGTLILTTEAVVFKSPTYCERIPYKRIMDINVLIDSYVVYKRTGKPCVFAVRDLDSGFAAMLLAMVSNTGVKISEPNQDLGDYVAL